MKKIKKVLKDNFIYLIMIIAIIAGGVVIGVKGFEYNLDNVNHQRLEIILNSPYDDKEMSKLISEVVTEKHTVRTSSIFNTTVAIDAKSFDDELITNILNKINEKYETEYTLKNLKLTDIIDEYELTDVDSMEDDEINEIIEKVKEEYGLEYTKEELADTSSIKVALSDVTAINVLDSLKAFIIPIVIAVILILLYIELRGLKHDKLIALKVLLKLVILEAFLTAVIAIIRFPLNNIVTTAFVVIGIIYLLVANVKNENALKKHDEKEKTE